ncbi:MAG TPA: universal stress protein [Gemmataceae bacterium]|nr:universal stress protein [Gemmataceae bacterium]
MRHIKTILHPTDFSEPCAAALEIACSLARDHHAKLLLIHVVPPVAPLTEGGDRLALRRAESRQQDQMSYQDEMRNKLQQLAIPAKHVPTERLFAQGGVVDEILRAAKDRSCDVIVMGTHGWPGEARHLLGSIAEGVMTEAPCPVITVKARLELIQSGERHKEQTAGVVA